MTAPLILRRSPSGPPVLVAGSFIESDVVGVLATEGLRALPGEPGLVAVASGYHTPGDRGSGAFVWDAAGAPNDDGLFIALGVPYGSNVAGPGWRRLTDGGAIDAAWFGALGDYDPNTNTGGTYDTAALQRALAALATAGPRYSLEIPDGIYLITGTLQLLTGQTVTGRGSAILWGRAVDSIARIGTLSPALISDAVNLENLTFLGSGPAGSCALDVYAAASCSASKVYIGGSFTYAVRSHIIGVAGGVAYNCRFEFLRFSYSPSRYPFAAPATPTNGVHIIGAWTATNLRTDLFAVPDYSVFAQQQDPAGIMQFNLEGMIQGAGFTGGVGIGVQITGGVRCRIRDLYCEANQVYDVNLINCFGTRVTASEVIVRERGCTGTVVDQVLAIDSDTTCKGTQVLGALSTGALPSSTIRTNALNVTGYDYAAEVARAGLWDAPVVHAEPANLVINGDFRRWISGSSLWGVVASSNATFARCGEGQVDTTRTDGSPLCAKVSGGALTWGVKLFAALPASYTGNTVTVSLKSKIAVDGPGMLMQLGELGGVGWDVTKPSITLKNSTKTCENGFAFYVYTFEITEAIRATGAQLNFQVLGATETYVSELQVCMGVGAPRHYQGNARTFDGTVTASPNGGIEIYSSASPGGTDAFYGAPFLVGDRALNTASSFPQAWVVSTVGPVVWRPESVQSYLGAGTLDPGALPALGSLRVVNQGALYWKGLGGTTNHRFLGQGAADEFLIGDGQQTNTFLELNAVWNWLVRFSATTRWTVTDRNFLMDQALELNPVPIPANPTGNRKKIFVGDGSGGTVAGTLYQLNSAGVFTAL